MKTATFLIAAILVMAPSYAQAAPSADFEKISILQSQITALQAKLDRLIFLQQNPTAKSAPEVKKETKKLKASSNKKSLMNEQVAELDAAWKKYSFKNGFQWEYVPVKEVWVIREGSKVVKTTPASKADAEKYDTYQKERVSLLGE